jgi:hypothetical protein
MCYWTFRGAGGSLRPRSGAYSACVRGLRRFSYSVDPNVTFTLPDGTGVKRTVRAGQRIIVSDAFLGLKKSSEFKYLIKSADVASLLHTNLPFFMDEWTCVNDITQEQIQSINAVRLEFKIIKESSTKRDKSPWYKSVIKIW